MNDLLKFHITTINQPNFENYKDEINELSKLFGFDLEKEYQTLQHLPILFISNSCEKIPMFHNNTLNNHLSIKDYLAIIDIYIKDLFIYEISNFDFVSPAISTYYLSSIEYNTFKTEFESETFEIKRISKVKLKESLAFNFNNLTQI